MYETLRKALYICRPTYCQIAWNSRFKTLMHIITNMIYSLQKFLSVYKERWEWWNIVEYTITCLRTVSHIIIFMALLSIVTQLCTVLALHLVCDSLWSKAVWCSLFLVWVQTLADLWSNNWMTGCCWRRSKVATVRNSTPQSILYMWTQVSNTVFIVSVCFVQRKNTLIH